MDIVNLRYLFRRRYLCEHAAGKSLLNGHYLLAVIGLISLATFHLKNASAQDQNWQQTSLGKRTRNVLPSVKRPIINDDPANHYNLLKSPVELPYVPPYSGRATFVSGWLYPDDPIARRTDLVYRVHEDEAEVLNWYRTALSSYQWKVNQSRSAKNQITASKGKLGFTIFVRPCSTPGFQTELRLSYREVR